MTTDAMLTSQYTTHGATAAPVGWNAYLEQFGYDGFHLRSEWATIFSNGLKHEPKFFWATDESNNIVGALPVMFVAGPIFGKYLCSQPYLNTGGVLADNDDIAAALIEQACQFADERDVKHLEMRHERAIEHPKFNGQLTEKVHMRLDLPSSADEYWDSLKSKVRSQIRKPRNNEKLTVRFGHLEELSVFYDIFCRNMRDLGTPPFSKRLFELMLTEFGDNAEIVTVSYEGKDCASGFLLHGPGTTLIPSASALREFNKTSCNMLMYWHSLERTIERGQTCFDFGRSSVDAGTHKFKKQWGSQEYPATWQYYARKGSITDARPNSGKYDAMIATWQKLPVWLTKLIGPTIIRGVP